MKNLRIRHLLKAMFLISLMIFLSSCSFMSKNLTSEQQSNKKIYKDSVMTTNVDTAIFAGGCFWCSEAMFEELKGVQSVESGYSGGTVANPSYEQVCTGTTGHAESIRIIYDPSVITYEDLLKIFFTTHDPTTLNRQGADAGTQYRSAIFYLNDKQKEASEKVKKEFAPTIWDDPIVTEITAYKNFYKAEDYHQNYYDQNPNQGYCRVVITPKVKKFREEFKEKLKQ
jgi:peptide-methionine (S)-S-oxide reductase